jgi:hypothetical protein
MSSDDRSRRPKEPASGDNTPSSTDFGSFVSSSVRDSFRKLKPETPATTPAPAQEQAPASRRSRRRREPAESLDAPTVPSSQLGTPVGRKWRDTQP